MSIHSPAQGISLTQQLAQGFLTLPTTPLSITIGTGFSTALAGVPSRDPFLYRSSPFDQETLTAQRFVFTWTKGSRGVFSSSTTTGSSTTNEHTSVSLGVSVGNDYLNAGVTGSYDKSVLANTAASKSSRHCSYQCGIIQSTRDVPLSASAIALLRSDGNGISAFTDLYGDYYVSSFIIGAESAVLLHTSSLDVQNTEDVKLVAEIEFFCFSDTETIAEKTFIEQHSDARFGVTAFDTLENQFVDIGNEGTLGPGLTIDQARSLAKLYADRVEALPRRVLEPLERLASVLDPKSTRQAFDRTTLETVMSSGLVLQVLLMPFARMREVMEILAQVT